MYVRFAGGRGKLLLGPPVYLGRSVRQGRPEKVGEIGWDGYGGGNMSGIPFFLSSLCRMWTLVQSGGESCGNEVVQLTVVCEYSTFPKTEVI